MEPVIGPLVLVLDLEKVTSVRNRRQSLDVAKEHSRASIIRCLLPLNFLHSF